MDRREDCGEGLRVNRRLLPIDAIFINPKRRAPDMARVASIAESIGDVGLMNPPAVCIRNEVTMDDGEVCDGVPVLIYGHHRILALQHRGEVAVECVVYDVDDLHAELMEISENLHRSELTVLQRSEAIARWIELIGQRDVLRQVDAKPGRPEGGTRAAARELGISEPDARRSVAVASLSEAAKEEARKTGADEVQSVLLSAAKGKTPDEQVRSIKEWDTQRELAKAKAAVERKRNAAAVVQNGLDEEILIADFIAAWQAIPEHRRGEALSEISASNYIREAA